MKNIFYSILHKCILLLRPGIELVTSHWSSAQTDLILTCKLILRTEDINRHSVWSLAILLDLFSAIRLLGADRFRSDVRMHLFAFCRVGVLWNWVAKFEYITLHVNRAWISRHIPFFRTTRGLRPHFYGPCCLQLKTVQTVDKLTEIPLSYRIHLNKQQTAWTRDWLILCKS